MFTNNKRQQLLLTLVLAFACAHVSAQIDPATLENWNAELREKFDEEAPGWVTDFANKKLPEFLELKYVEQDGSDDNSFVLAYDWNSKRDWTDEIQATDYGNNFGGSGYNASAKGSYAFADGYENTENSELGIAYQWRWFPVTFERLTEDDGRRVQQCMVGGTTDGDDLSAFTDEEISVDGCRARLGLNELKLSYQYFEVDLHAKVEGDQQFDQRNYRYGLEMSYSRNLGQQTLLIHPILTLGLEQVDPKNDMKRMAALASDDLYERAYAEFGVTSGVIPLGNVDLKLSYSWRYYRELSPEQAISDAGLDRFRYSAVALQVPTTIFPWFKAEQNNFMITYASGELPLSLADEQTISIGWRTDLDFNSILGLE